MRKVLSLVLVLALVLGSFSMAFAADTTAAAKPAALTDIAGIANEDAIQVAFDLGIVTGNPDGTYQPDKAVTRAEFAALITRALAIPDSALAGYAQTSFKDTTGYGWAVPYLAFCNSKGIMLGDGNGNAMPGRTISVNEAMTMALRAIGYTSNSAELVGAWPSNYVTLAQNLSLYDDVAKTTIVNKASAAQIIYNVLDENLVAVNADGKTDPIEKDGDFQSLLTTGLGCTADENGDSYMFEKTDADTAVINAYKYIGAWVKSYSNDDGDVVAIAEVNSTFLTGSYDADDSEFTVGDTVYNLDDSDIGYAVDKHDYNPYSLTNDDTDTTNAAISGANLDADGTVTLAADVSGKTIKAVYSVNKWTAEEAFQFDADMLDTSDCTLNGYAFAQDDNDNIDNAKFSLYGAASLDKIAKDSVVEVFLADPANADSDIVKVTVGTEKVSGRITVEDDGDYTINGKVYSIATDGAFSADLDELTSDSLGDKGTAYLDYDGNIALWEVSDASADNYAVVSGEVVTSGRDQMLELVDKTGTEKDYVLTSDVVNGTDFTTDGATGIDMVDDLAAGDLVTFSLDKNGKIDSLTALDYTDQVDDQQVNKGRTLFGNDRIDTGVVVFTYDGTDFSDSDFSVIPLASVETEKDLVGTSYYQDGSSIAVMVIKDNYTGAESKYAVLNSAKPSYNAADDEVNLVKGFVGGKEYTAYSEDRGDLDLNASFDATNIYKLTVDANGVITDVEATTGESISPVSGTVWDKDGNYLVKVGTTTANAIWRTIDPNAVVYKYDSTESNVWSTAKLSDIKKDSNSVVGSEVFLFQMDDDSEVYDFIVIDKSGDYAL